MVSDPEAFGETQICDRNPSADKAVIHVYLLNLMQTTGLERWHFKHITVS